MGRTGLESLPILRGNEFIDQHPVTEQTNSLQSIFVNFFLIFTGLCEPVEFNRFRDLLFCFDYCLTEILYHLRYG